MTTDQLTELFTKHADEFLKFERVESKTSNRADLHAFNLLDKLVPGECDIICAAEHDEFWLEVAPEDLAKAATTEEQIVELIRCGVRYDSEYDCLAMFT
jgi:hypothetical protein